MNKLSLVATSENKLYRTVLLQLRKETQIFDFLSILFDNKTAPTLWHNLTEFLQTKNIALEITRLNALLCITIGSH